MSTTTTTKPPVYPRYFVEVGDRRTSRKLELFIKPQADHHLCLASAPIKHDDCQIFEQDEDYSLEDVLDPDSFISRSVPYKITVMPDESSTKELLVKRSRGGTIKLFPMPLGEDDQALLDLADEPISDPLAEDDETEIIGEEEGEEGESELQDEEAIGGDEEEQDDLYPYAASFRYVVGAHKENDLDDDCSIALLKFGHIRDDDSGTFRLRFHKFTLLVPWGPEAQHVFRHEKSIESLALQNRIMHAAFQTESYIASPIFEQEHTEGLIGKSIASRISGAAKKTASPFKKAGKKVGKAASTVRKSGVGKAVGRTAIRVSKAAGRAGASVKSAAGRARTSIADRTRPARQAVTRRATAVREKVTNKKGTGIVDRGRDRITSVKTSVRTRVDSLRGKKVQGGAKLGASKGNEPNRKYEPGKSKESGGATKAFAVDGNKAPKPGRQRPNLVEHDKAGRQTAVEEHRGPITSKDTGQHRPNRPTPAAPAGNRGNQIAPITDKQRNKPIPKAPAGKAAASTDHSPAAYKPSSGPPPKRADETVAQHQKRVQAWKDLQHQQKSSGTPENRPPAPRRHEQGVAPHNGAPAENVRAPDSADRYQKLPPPTGAPRKDLPAVPPPKPAPNPMQGAPKEPAPTPPVVQQNHNHNHSPPAEPKPKKEKPEKPSLASRAKNKLDSASEKGSLSERESSGRGGGGDSSTSAGGQGGARAANFDGEVSGQGQGQARSARADGFSSNASDSQQQGQGLQVNAPLPPGVVLTANGYAIQGTDGMLYPYPGTGAPGQPILPPEAKQPLQPGGVPADQQQGQQQQQQNTVDTSTGRTVRLAQDDEDLSAGDAPIGAPLSDAERRARNDRVLRGTLALFETTFGRKPTPEQKEALRSRINSITAPFVMMKVIAQYTDWLANDAGLRFSSTADVKVATPVAA